MIFVSSVIEHGLFFAKGSENSNYNAGNTIANINVIMTSEASQTHTQLGGQKRNAVSHKFNY